MSGKRYAVLDKNGHVINHVLINDPMPAGSYTGYGTYLMPLEECDYSAKAAMDILVFKTDVIPQIGDTVNIDTGEVTKFVPEIITQKDEKGEDILVASGPVIKMETEVERKEGEIIVKEAPTKETTRGFK